MEVDHASAPATVTIEEDLRVPTGDATVAASRYRPTDSDGPLPAILMYTPYHKGDIITFGGYDPLLRYIAAHGYEVIAADMVGTGASSGHMDEMFHHREGEQGAEIVAWIADQPWTTGRVGMIGKSYGGITALYTAAERPPSLDAIIPVLTPYTGFRNGYFGDGLFELFGIGGDWLPLMQALGVKPPLRRDETGQWAEVWRKRLETIAKRDPWLFQFQAHPTKDRYWTDKDIDISRIETPTFAVGGWRDGYTRETEEFFDGIDGPKRLLFGPWRHTMPHRGREAAIDFRRQAVEWFDHFLKDEDNGALNRPRITYWTERDGGTEAGTGLWRGTDAWPTVDNTEDCLTFAAGVDGLLPIDEFETGEVKREYVIDQTVGVHSVDDLVSPTDGRPIDTHDDDRRSCCFETGPLTDPIELTGTASATIHLDSTASDPLVVVRLVDVSPSGIGRLVTRGFVRPGFKGPRAGDSPSVTTKQKSEVDVSIGFDPKSHVFEAGHRIRLAISGAYFPLIMPARSHGLFVVRSTPDAPTTVRFPGRQFDTDEFTDRVPMAGPDESVSSTVEFLTNEDATFEITRDRLAATATVASHSEYGFDVPAGEHVRFAQDIEASVAADKPEAVVLTSDTEIEMEYEHERVLVESTVRLTLDTGQVTTRVSIDDHQIFEETWSR